MSVLIKGMEMPKNCNICPFSKTNDDLESDDYRFRYCDFPFIGEFVTDYEKSRHPDCPLVELPPHGRLIDADALMKHKGDCYDAKGHLLYAIGTGNVMCAPTIIEAEVDNA